MSISLRISPQVKRRIRRLAAASETTPHAFMVAAIEEKLRAEELHAAFVSEAEQRLSSMKEGSTGIPADEVFQHLRRRATGKPSRRPRARPIS